MDGCNYRMEEAEEEKVQENFPGLNNRPKVEQSINPKPKNEGPVEL